MKIDSTGLLGKMFMSIPEQLSRGTLIYYAISVAGNIDADKKREMLVNLEDSKTVLISYHTDDPNVGMSLTKDESRYKLFVCDTGLFITLAFWDRNFTENMVYQKLLSYKLEANLGYVYENLTAQWILSCKMITFAHDY